MLTQLSILEEYQIGIFLTIFQVILQDGIATLNPIFAGENCRGLFSIWDNTSGIREQITFYAGVSYGRGAFLDVVSHNCYGYNSLIDSIKIQSSNSNVYDPVNIYIFRKNSFSTTKLSVSLNNYLSVPSDFSNIGEWKLTPNALPISTEKNLICDLTKTKSLEPYSYTTLNKNFQGSVSRSTAVLEDDDLTTKQYVDARDTIATAKIDSLESVISTLDSILNSATPSSVTYSIGDTAQGGIVFYVSPDGKNGLVAATVDQASATNMYQATNVVSVPYLHTLEGQRFLDWRLPTSWELNEMYLNLHQQGLGGFAIGSPNPASSPSSPFQSLYWSSTMNSNFNGLVSQFFSNGNQCNGCGGFFRVRAVRAF
jgi:hypothetical protein